MERRLSVEPRTPSSARTVPPYAHGSSSTSLAVSSDFDRPRKDSSGAGDMGFGSLKALGGRA